MGQKRLGIDIGGSGMKAAVVDMDNGSLDSERFKVETPRPSTPAAMSGALRKLLDMAGHQGPIGVGFPSAVVDGIVLTANNIDKSWIGVNVVELFSDVAGDDVCVVNDADAAAICEARFGAARGVRGLVLVVTFGTGIGSGLLYDGELVPNLQLGDIELDGHLPAETYFSASARERDGLTWEEWAPRVERFLDHLAILFTPQLMVVGGGVARRWDQWGGLINPRAPVVRADFGNNAGIVGAATLLEGQRE